MKTYRRFCLPFIIHRSSFIIFLLLLCGCEKDMGAQPRYDPLEASSFFSNGQDSRPLVPGTVARGHLRVDDALYAGVVDGQPVTELPVPVDLALLQRGRERFNIFCAPCHDQTGSGEGMVVRRGFPRPPSYHTDRLRQAPVGYFFDVATRGFGRMPSYAEQVPTEDRWAIVAYIRALQLSQHADLPELSPEDQEQLQKVAP